MNLPEEIRLLLFDLTDGDECDYDHHGYCQAHMWFEGATPCPHKRAKELLGDEVWVRVTINTRATPILEVDEDGDWRVNVGAEKGRTNILWAPGMELEGEYWLVKK